MRRRKLLSLVGVGIIGGCLGEADRTSTATGGSPTPSPANPIGTDQVAKSCVSDKDPVTAYGSETESSIRGLEISAGQEALHRGDELTIRMQNNAEERRDTGNRSKYDIQRRVSGQWRSIFWRDPDDLVMFHDDAIGHEPDEGFTWRLQMTKETLTHEIENGSGTLHVCSAIAPGVYQFVFHGASMYDEDGNEVQAHLGTQFEVLAD